MNRGTCHGVYPMSKYLLILVAKDCDSNLEDLYSFYYYFIIMSMIIINIRRD